MASVAALAVGGRGTPFDTYGSGGILPGFDAYPRSGDPLLRELAARALDAARAAGATYADVRFTLTRTEEIRFYGTAQYSIVQNDEYAAVGVRTLVDGAWGFAASPLWAPDEVARLAQTAATQAKTNAARGRRRAIELGDPPPPATGEWRTPIERDPFDVSLAEKIEIGWAFNELASRYNLGARNASAGASSIMRWRRQEKTFASTEGAFLSQTLYSAFPSYSVGVSTPEGNAGRGSEILKPTAGGFEVFANARLGEEVPQLVEDALLMVGAERVQPLRYDIVFDGFAVGQILARTVGIAAELDRVLGYEANAGGTSYLAPPEEKLGSFALGSKLLNIKGNRSRPGGLATVKWDDEGVEPEEYALVRDGVLVDYHTTRELAGALAPLYAKAGRAVRSHGCAASESGIANTLLHPPNLEMLPGAGSTTLADLEASLEKGIVIRGGSASVDRQQLNGEFNGAMVYEVRKGKRTRFLGGTEVLFRAPELWKSLKAIGGKGTQVWSGATSRKGQPGQAFDFSVGAVPALFTNVAVTDIMRKA
jgi:TldD protein